MGRCHADNRIGNGGFEVVQDPALKPSGYTVSLDTLYAWTLTSGDGHELFTAAAGVTPSEGRFGLDLEGATPGSNRAISQRVDGATEGAVFRIAFDAMTLNGAAQARLEVSWGGTILTWGPSNAPYLDPTVSWETSYIDVTGGAGSGAQRNLLTFREIGSADGNGTLLANIRMYSVTAGEAFGADERFVVTSGSGDDSLDAGAGADVLRTGAGNDSVQGGAGNDDVDLGTGVDWYGDDVGTATEAVVLNLETPDSVAILDGMGTVRGAEFMTLVTGSGNDNITTRRTDFLDDQFSTGEGADTLRGIRGHDGWDAGGGEDVLIADLSTATYAIQLALTAGAGGGHDGVAGSQLNAAHSWLVFSGVERFDLASGSAADLLGGGDGADILRAAAGHDSLSGGGGG